MPSKICALLVGINDYLGGVPGLNGCVNDVKRMAEFLQLRVQDGEFDFDRAVSELEEAVRLDPDNVWPTITWARPSEPKSTATPSSAPRMFCGHACHEVHR